MKSELYSMIIDNEYDYDNDGTTTDNKQIAFQWLRAGVQEIAILDALSYEYLGEYSQDDLPENGGELDYVDDDYYDSDRW